MSNTLVDIQSIIPSIQIDLKYATKENFTGRVVYDFDRCLLLKKATLQLLKVQKELQKQKLALKVWDGFRPLAAQEAFWKILPDERYISDPKKGGRHTRGTAIDLTLISEGGIELRMPSLFDDFSEKAHRDYMDATKEEIKSREILQTVMEKHGFIGLPTEWWHFDLVGWEQYPPINSFPKELIRKTLYESGKSPIFR